MSGMAIIREPELGGMPACSLCSRLSVVGLNCRTRQVKALFLCAGCAAGAFAVLAEHFRENPSSLPKIESATWPGPPKRGA